MIVSPNNWKEIGQPIKLKKIEDTLMQILSEIDCNSLSFSGGVDSSLLLYFLMKIGRRVNAFTIGKSPKHPDIIYSSKVIDGIGKNVNHIIYIPKKKDIDKEKRPEDFEGDEAIRLFYKYVMRYTDGIIAGDGIDEFSCGYYDHQRNPTESTYYKFLRQLRPEQLIPLDKNSGDVKVYLPYIDRRLIILFSQIPIKDKADKKDRKKIILSIAKDKLPPVILKRWKYGFCHALKIKEEKNEGNT